MDVNAEDQWKYTLRDRLVAAPDNDDNEEAKKMIARLLELPSEDPASDEAFDALMENGAYCFDPTHEIMLQLGYQDDVAYPNLTPDGMPYLKKFLSEIPRNMKILRLKIVEPEILRTFPAQIGNEESALQMISIWIPDSSDYYHDMGRLEDLSLANMLYVTRNVEEVFLDGFHAFTPNNNGTNSSLKAFHSQTKKIQLSGIIVCDESSIVLHPDTTVAFESIAFSFFDVEPITLRLRDCLPLFPAGRAPFSSKLRSLDIRRFCFDRDQSDFYDSQHILRLLEVSPCLLFLRIDVLNIVDEKDAEKIVDGISSHKTLCWFECDNEFSEALKLPCLLNRFNASGKELPLGFIPNVVLRSQELCGVSGIYQFVRQKAVPLLFGKMERPEKGWCDLHVMGPGSAPFKRHLFTCWFRKYRTILICNTFRICIHVNFNCYVVHYRQLDHCVQY